MYRFETYTRMRMQPNLIPYIQYSAAVLVRSLSYYMTNLDHNTNQCVHAERGEGVTVKKHERIQITHT